MKAAPPTFQTVVSKLQAPALVLLILFLALSCSSPQTPEEEIQEYVRTAEEAFAKKDAGDIKKLIARDYQDKRNLRRQDITRILAGYFLRNQKAFILSTMDELHFSDGDTTADFRLFAALSATPLSGNDLQLLDADCYMLTGTLRKNGDWLLTTADLQRISVDEFIGSLK